MDDMLFSIFPNENFVDLNLYQYGWQQCAPSHSYGPATRTHFLFHYVISGTGTLYADDAAGHTHIYQIKSGQGFLVFPDQINTYIADKELPWEYTWLEFDGLRAKEALEVAGISPDMPIYRSHTYELRNTMMQEMLYIAHHSDMAPFHLIGHLYLFLEAFMNSIASRKVSRGDTVKDYHIREALVYIERNFQNDISVEDIAENCGLNRSYFGKIFKEMVGDTPQAFLLHYRMTKAGELLKLTDLPIGDISKAVGYDNPLHFSRAFKNIYGVSPRAWRNQNQIRN